MPEITQASAMRPTALADSAPTVTATSMTTAAKASHYSDVNAVAPIASASSSTMG